MRFTADSLLEQLAEYPPGSKFALAYSGGLDSTVLLHAMHRAVAIASAPYGGSPVYFLRAIHINHGLSPNAKQWQSLCEQTCAHLGIPLYVERLRMDPSATANLENEARARRYEVFARELAADECLLMAHHTDDQAETFLLRSLRGAGPRGLAAIPRQRALSKATLLRPLLAVSRAALLTYAEGESLAWVEDESNINERFDRNFLRQSVLPGIASRWPAYRESWQRSAQLCAEANMLLDELGAIDCEQLKTQARNIIDAKQLQLLSPARQRNALRHWLAVAGAPDPGWNVLQQIVEQLLPAAVDAQAQLQWRGQSKHVILRRYRQRLHLHSVVAEAQPIGALAWDPHEALALPANGRVYTVSANGFGLRQSAATALTVRYRQGGESCKLHGRKTRPLKKILQDAHIAPWLRERLPLLYCADDLVYIPGVGVCEGWQAGPDELGWQVIWEPPDAAPEH